MSTDTLQEASVTSVTDVDFRAAMSRFASGVTVITAHAFGQDWGATVSAFSSVSNDPPSVLVCLNTTSDTCAAVRESRSFVVNILSHAQADLAVRFAGKGVGKFDEVDMERSPEGHPVLADAHLSLDCRVAQAVVAGTHVIFVATVESIEFGGSTAPLTYHSGRFGRFSPSPVPRAPRDDISAFGHLYDLW